MASGRIRQRRQTRPGFNGRMEVRDTTVDNPYDNPRAPYVDTQRNIRECPADTLKAQGHINEAEHRASNQFRRLYEASQGGKSQGVIDPSNEPVDCSAPQGDRYTDRQRQAARELGRLSAALGKLDYQICVHVCGDGRTIKEVATIFEQGEPSRKTRLEFGDRFRRALTVLAQEFGLAS